MGRNPKDSIWHSTPAAMRNRPPVTGSVRRAVAVAFRQAATARRLTVSDALEEALVAWLRARGIEVPDEEQEPPA